MTAKRLNDLLKPVAMLAMASLAIATGVLIAASTFTPGAQPTGWVAGPEVSDFNVSGGQETIYQTDYEREFWSGNLYAYPINANGDVETAAERWTGGLADHLSEQNYDLDRRIVTMHTNGTGVPFRWANLESHQQSAIGDGTKGPAIVNFVRGDQSNENPNGLKFRVRSNGVLGDIIHSRPLYVYDETNPMVYVGANDGMLHAVDAKTGREVYTYVPSMLIPQLKNLAPIAPTVYTHTYFVDATPNSAEITVSGATRRILVGGLGAGEKGLYALDITNDATSPVDVESTATSRVLWEITETTINNANSTSYAKLGYTYGVPLIGKLTSTGQDVVIAANGYLSSTGKAVLYVINAATGAMIREIDTGSGSAGSPNGLSTPTAVDVNSDGRIDYVYAGDLDGHMWKFDLTSATTTAWTATLLHTTSPAQPIVSAPGAAAHPSGGVMVTFGTGKAFTDADLADTTTYYVYGIRDGAPAAATTILAQTLTAANYTNAGVTTRVRTASANAFDLAVHRGWKVALPAGERVVADGTFIANGRYYFTSWNPTINPTATVRGENWLNELDYLNGGAKTRPFLDLNGDIVLNDYDRVVDAGGVAIAGAPGVPVARYLGAGVQSQPILVQLASLDSTITNQNPDAIFPPPPAVTTDPGVAGGHFDVDIYYPTCATKNGVTTCSFAGHQHFHQYDDKFDVTGVNMLNASSATLNLVNAIASTSTPFRVLVMNQYLSPGVTLSVGGATHTSVKTYNGLASQTNAATLLASLPVYTRANINTFEFNMPTNTFTPRDWWGNGDVRSGLIPTATGCVNSVDSKSGVDKTKGIQGERHNGALTIQIIKDTVPSTSLELNVAGKVEYGWRVKEDANWTTNVLAEYTVFWHASVGCYVAGNSSWTKTPPPAKAGKAGGATNRAAGSTDPVAGVSTATIPTLSIVTTTSGNTTTTVVTYLNGTTQTTTRTRNADGTVIVRVVNPDGTVQETSVADPRGSLIVGADESRLAARTGRVSWQERIRQ